MPARIVLLVTSPRLPAGLLSAAAWDLVRGTPVFAAAESAQTAALRTVGVSITLTDHPVDDLLAAGDAVWLAGPAGDEQLARELGLRLARAPGLAELELMYGSWDPPGARLLDAVTVMDRLRSPGWQRSCQTAGPGTWTTLPGTWSTRWSGATRTCSPMPPCATWTRSSSSGTGSSARRSRATRSSTVSRCPSPPWRWPRRFSPGSAKPACRFRCRPATGWGSGCCARSPRVVPTPRARCGARHWPTPRGYGQRSGAEGASGSGAASSGLRSAATREDGA